jgi:hypothetical protein
MLLTFPIKTKLQVVGSGQVKFELNVQGKQKKCVIKNVLRVPMFYYNLLSVSEMEVHGDTVCEWKMHDYEQKQTLLPLKEREEVKFMS